MKELRQHIFEKLKVSKDVKTYWEWEPTTERVDASEFTRVIKEYVKTHGEYDLVSLLGEDNLPVYLQNGEVYHIKAVSVDLASHKNDYLIYAYIHNPKYWADFNTYNLDGLRSYLGSSLEYINKRRKRTVNNDEKGQAILMKIYNDMKDEVDQ